jgi:hypothetical protein
MAAWVTIYCKRSLAGAVPEQVRSCIDAADWHTLAEGYDVEDERVVDAALAHFRIEELPRAEGDLDCEVYRVYYRPGGQRQIDVWRWTRPEQVAEQVAEELGELKGARRAGVKQVREHLARVKDVVSIELGWGQLGGMPVVLAYEIARHLAHAGHGWIKDHEDRWWALTRGGGYKPITSS